MFRKAVLLILLSKIVLFMSCSELKNLAEYEHGEVRLYDLKSKLLADGEYRSGSFMADAQKQREVVLEIAKDKEMAHEAVERDLHKTEKFKKELNNIEAYEKENVFFDIVLREKSDLSSKDIKRLANLYEAQILLFHAPVFFDKKLYESRKNDAGEAYAMIKSGKSFEEVSRKYSGMSVYSGKKDFEYIGSFNDPDYEIMRRIAEMKEGALAFIGFSRGFAIVKLIDKKEKSEEDRLRIEYLPSEQRHYAKNKYYWKKEEYRNKRIAGDKGIKRNYALLRENSKTKPDNVLLSYKGEKLLYKEYEHEIKRLKQYANKNEAIAQRLEHIRSSYPAKLHFVESALGYPLIRQKYWEDASLDGHPEFKMIMSVRRRELLLRHLKKKIGKEKMRRLRISKQVKLIERNIVSRYDPRRKDNFAEFKKKIADIFGLSLKDKKERLFETFSEIYAPLHKLSKEEYRKNLKEKRAQLSKLNIKLYKLFLKHERPAEFCVDAAEFFYENNDTSLSEYWVNRLKESVGFDVSHAKGLIDTDDETKRLIMLNALSDLRDRRLHEFFMELLQQDINVNEKSFVISALGNMRSRKSVPILEKMMYDTNEIWGLRIISKEALIDITGDGYTNVEIKPAGF